MIELKKEIEKGNVEEYIPVILSKRQALSVLASNTINISVLDTQMEQSKLSKVEARDMIKNAKKLLVSGPMALKSKHGLCVHSKEGEICFLHTDMKKILNIKKLAYNEAGIEFKKIKK